MSALFLPILFQGLGFDLGSMWGTLWPDTYEILLVLASRPLTLLDTSWAGGNQCFKNLESLDMVLIEKDYLTHIIDYFTLCSFSMILGLSRSYTCILKHNYALMRNHLSCLQRRSAGISWPVVSLDRAAWGRSFELWVWTCSDPAGLVSLPQRR